MRGMPDKVAVIAVSEAGMTTALRLKENGFSGDLYCPESLAQQVVSYPEMRLFGNGVVSLASQLFTEYNGMVFIMPTGIVVRSIAPLIKSKLSDPAVVTVDVGGRWAVALLGGHEGGANDLTASVARVLHGEPVITTSTEAVKTLIAGIGCRKGVSMENIGTAVSFALESAGCSLHEIRIVATVDAKQNEAGLLEFCERNSLPLRVISREEIREARIQCDRSDFVHKTLGIGAVAVPCALLGGSKTGLLTDRITCCQVTVALARENCMW